MGEHLDRTKLLITKDVVLKTCNYKDGLLSRVDGKRFYKGPSMRILGCNFMVSHLSWFMEYGEWSKFSLRFIDGNKDNVNISNIMEIK